MFLRITDVLIDLLITELLRLDKIDKVQKLRSTDGLTHLKRLEAEMKKIGISEEVEMENTDWTGKTTPIPENSHPNLVYRAK